MDRTPLARRGRLISRIRMPLVALAALALVVGVVVDPGPWFRWTQLALFVVAAALYARVGTPTGVPVEARSPLRSPAQVVNSPSSRVPSHHLHAWSQTYAADLLPQPEGSRHPDPGWSPLARRPEDFPAFGQPVLAPVSGRVVRARDALRDHWSRTSPPALVYLFVESVRELLGPAGVLGNHVVVERDDGACVLLAHLRRRSLRVRRGDRVAVGDVLAECGNSGNSTEPHVHVQAMDRPSVWVAAGLPLRFDGHEPPPSGAVLEPAARRDRPS